jgi:hypothetical protein
MRPAENGAQGSAPVEIRANWIVAPSDWTPLLPEKTGSPEAQGVQYEVQR